MGAVPADGQPSQAALDGRPIVWRRPDSEMGAYKLTCWKVFRIESSGEILEITLLSDQRALTDQA